MKTFIAVAALSMICGLAFAQNTGAPAVAQSDMNKPGMANDKGTMTKGTTGTGMTKDGMRNDNNMQGGASKDGMGQQNKGGMSK